MSVSYTHLDVYKRQAWIQHNKKHFKNTAILPINNMNITTATNKKERVKQQAYVTLTYKNLELACPMIIMHKLTYDGILGIPLCMPRTPWASVYAAGN